MKKEFFNEIFIGIILLLLSVMILKPFGLFMSSEFSLLICLLIAFVFLIFAVLSLKEKARDEREEYLQMQTGRISWLAGTAVLTVGIVFQSVMGVLDPWLVYVFMAMVGSKIVMKIYFKIKNK